MAEGTGFLRTTGDGLELVLVRELLVSPEELWAWVTESEKLARWIGPFEGDAAVGSVVHLTMTEEESSEPQPVTILECDPSRRLALEMANGGGGWQLQLDISVRGDGTLLTFNQLIEQGDDITSVGPGWEYYLDRLVAAITGAAPSPWDAYYPALVGYYSELE